MSEGYVKTMMCKDLINKNLILYRKLRQRSCKVYSIARYDRK